MGLKRWSARRDAIEKPIVQALRAVGADVTRVSGKGAPDLLVRYKGRIAVFEVKSAKGDRTVAQDETKWPIVRSVEEALREIGVQR
jgi:Holliday junction resolvase